MKSNEDIKIKYIKTKNKKRKIATYINEDCYLRKEHERILKIINKNFINSIFAKAYIKQRSIYFNAESHMYNDFFIMLDVKNFFNSINHNILIDKLYYELNKRNKKLISKIECRSIVKKCSINDKGIPLGFITSPILSNVYLKDFDGILYGKLKKYKEYNIIYTRYADDITISFKDNENKKQIAEEIIEIVRRLLRRYCLQLNENKTRFRDLSYSNHVKITGVNIIKNEDNYRRLSVGKSIKNKLFWDSIKCMECPNRDVLLVQKIKGMQSFILSIEKVDYEKNYSENMMNILKRFGFNSLKELIDSL